MRFILFENGQFTSLTEVKTDASCFSAEFGMNDSGFMLFVGLGSNKLKAINVFEKLSNEVVYMIFGKKRSDFLGCKDL